VNHIELFRFSPEVANGAKYEIPPIYHWANLIGARPPLEMCGYHSPVPPVESFKLTFAKDKGDSLEFKSEQTHKGGYRGGTEFRLAWHNPVNTPVDHVEAGGFVGFVTEQAHSGKYSLKVVGRGLGKVASFAPIGGGPGVIGESRKRYRLTAWVKAALGEGSAYLRVDDAGWSWDDVRASRKTTEVGGRSERTQLAAEFQPGPDDPFLVVRICVDGQGVAWFDDVMLEEVKD